MALKEISGLMGGSESARCTIIWISTFFAVLLLEVSFKLCHAKQRTGHAMLQ